jgi:hypothetical protein
MRWPVSKLGRAVLRGQAQAKGRQVGRQADRQARNVGCLGAEANERKQQRDDDHAKSEGKCEVSGKEE